MVRKFIKNITGAFIAAIILIFHTQTVFAEEPVINQEYFPYIEEIAKEYSICPELIAAIIWKESRWDPEAKNAGCVGLMQINKKWHEDRMERLDVTDLSDPYQNILIGIDYLAELFTKYDDPYLVLMVYNGTSDAYEKWSREEYSKYAVNTCEISHLFEKENGK